MSHTNHVDGEIWTQPRISTKSLGELAGPVRAVDAGRVPVEPTDLDYRTAALNAAVKVQERSGGKVLDWAKHFERYLRGEAT